jgi:hypothetical protein
MDQILNSCVEQYTNMLVIHSFTRNSSHLLIKPWKIKGFGAQQSWQVRCQLSTLGERKPQEWHAPGT